MTEQTINAINAVIALRRSNAMKVAIEAIQCLTHDEIKTLQKFSSVGEKIIASAIISYIETVSSQFN